MALPPPGEEKGDTQGPTLDTSEQRPGQRATLSKRFEGRDWVSFTHSTRDESYKWRKGTDGAHEAPPLRSIPGAEGPKEEQRAVEA